MPRRALEIVARQRHLAPGQREVDPPAGRIDGHDRAPIAVDDAERGVVATHHDAVANRERRAGDGHLLGTERARGTHQRMRPPVEVVDVDPALRDHHRPVEIARRPPVRHQALAQRVGVLADDDPARVVVALNRLGRRTLAHEPQRLPLPLGRLPAVLLELDHRQPIHQRAERTAGSDRRELAVVADEHELDVEPASPARRAGRARASAACRPRRRRARRAAGTSSGMRSSALEQRRDARARDAGTFLELACRAARNRGAVDAAAARLPRVARRAERERLARPRRPDDSATPSPSSVEPPHHLTLLVDERRPRASARSTACGTRARRVRAAARDGELEDRSLEREQLRRRVDPLRGDGGDHAAVADSRTSRRSPATQRNGERDAGTRQRGAQHRSPVSDAPAGTPRRAPAERRGA